MGNRANFVVIQNGLATAFEDQWAAVACTYDFACGPEHASEALKTYSETTELMDWAFAEAGYLIDFDSRLAIAFGMPHGDEDIFGDEELGSDFEELKAMEDPSVAKLKEGDYQGFLEGIAGVWKGWKLVWDQRGADAFAEHLQKKAISGIETAAASHPPDTAPAVFHQA
ncbi:hypothetical protein [Luteolibacter soli]|uniref:Uncharacterized protein n=1 Tax=Luteolibacter soli TaxID=3135280 RepID=A0ABU9AYZ3_9BACT